MEKTQFFGCATGSWATATVTATNPYGTSSALNKNVYCSPIIP